MPAFYVHGKKGQTSLDLGIRCLTSQEARSVEENLKDNGWSETFITDEGGRRI